MVWPLLLGLPEHAKIVAARDCLLLLGIATTSFFAQLLMTRSFQLIPAARAAAVSFTGVMLFLFVAAVDVSRTHLHVGAHLNYYWYAPT
jgi:drug/metabolite transporter (DMT)-like permease